jgi:hypothetical protein
VVLRVADRVKSGSRVRVAAAVPARVRNGSRVKVARVKSGSRVKVAHVKAVQVVVRVVNGSRAKVAHVRAAQVVARVVNGSRGKVLVVMIVARVKSGSHVKVALVEMIVDLVRNGSHVKVVLVRVAQVVARVVNGSRVRVLVAITAARVKSGSRVKVVLVRVAQVVARVVNGSHVKAQVVMIVAQVVVHAVMTAAKTCRKPRRSVAALKCLLAKALVSTARISRLVTAQIAKSESSMKVRCVAASSTPIVARRATRRVVALAPSRALSVAMTARCFPLRQPCKSHWPAKFVVQLETVATTR